MRIGRLATNEGSRGGKGHETDADERRGRAREGESSDCWGGSARAPTPDGSGDAENGDARRATAAPYASESAARPPTVYAGRDGTPTVYFGPDGDEGAAAAAAAAARRHTADAGYLERLRQNRAGAARLNPSDAPTGSWGSRGTAANERARDAAEAPRRLLGRCGRVDGSRG